MPDLPPLVAPAIIRVSAHGSFNGEPFVNVFHFRDENSLDVNSSDLTALLDLLDDGEAVTHSLLHLYNGFDAGLNISRLVARTYEGSESMEIDRAVNLNGSSVGNDMPPMLAVMVKWSTDVATRRGRGRTYFTGLNTGWVDTADSDKVTAGPRATLQGRVSAFHNAWSNNVNFSFIVFSETAHRAGETSARAVAAGTVDPIIRIQRRRRTGS